MYYTLTIMSLLLDFYPTPIVSAMTRQALASQDQRTTDTVQQVPQLTILTQQKLETTTKGDTPIDCRGSFITLKPRP